MIFFTSRRLFDVRDLKTLGSFTVVVLVSPGIGLFELSKPSDETDKAMTELERKHDFVLNKEEIARLELLKTRIHRQRLTLGGFEIWEEDSENQV